MVLRGGDLASPGDRLRNARKRLGMTQVELSKASGVSQATISQIEKGSSPGSEAAWLKLARTLRLPPDEFNVSSIMAGEVKRLPVVDGIPKGRPGSAAKSGREMITVTPDQYDPTRYVLRVRGVSMYPRIRDGDRVLMEVYDLLLPRKGRERRGPELRALRELHGCVVAARLNREPTLKRIEIQHTDGNSSRVVLLSDNPEIPPRVIGKSDELHVVGRALEIWARC